MQRIDHPTPSVCGTAAGPSQHCVELCGELLPLVTAPRQHWHHHHCVELCHGQVSGHGGHFAGMMLSSALIHRRVVASGDDGNPTAAAYGNHMARECVHSACDNNKACSMNCT